MRYVAGCTIMGCWFAGGWGLVLGFAIGCVVDDWLGGGHYPDPGEGL